MTVYDFAAQRQAWQRIPVDDVGYLDSADLLAMSDHDLTALVERMAGVRYGGFRNPDGRWRTSLHLDDTTGKRVLDFGCGIGLESLQYARTGNEVHVADIVPSNVFLAQRVSELYGFKVAGHIAKDRAPFVPTIQRGSIDVFHSIGVIHHLPYDVAVMDWAAGLLAPGGEARLFLYSDYDWQRVVGKPPPKGPAAEHPSSELFVRAMDEVGGYADFYSPARLAERFGHRWDVAAFTYLDLGCTTILRPR